MSEDEYLRPEDAELAIARASAVDPKVQRARDRIARIIGEDERGVEMMAQAIRRMLRER